MIERQTTVLEAPPKQKARGTQPPQPVSRVWRSLPTLPRVWPHLGAEEGVLPNPRVRRGKEEGVWGALSWGRQGGRRKKTVAGR